MRAVHPDGYLYVRVVESGRAARAHSVSFALTRMVTFALKRQIQVDIDTPIFKWIYIHPYSSGYRYIGHMDLTYICTTCFLGARHVRIRLLSLYADVGIATCARHVRDLCATCAR